MNGIIKIMNYKKLLIIIGCCTIVLFGCDPGGALIFKDNLNSFEQDGLEIRFKGHTLGNINFGLAAYIKSVNNTIIYADSLKLMFKGSDVDYVIYYEGKRKGEEEFIFDVNNDSIMIEYGFNLDDASAGNELIIYAKNYFKRNMKYIDLDTITVLISKVNYPLIK